MKPLAAGVSAMRRSGIREIMDLAWSTPGTLHLEVGEPNFDTPPHVIRAAASAAKSGHTKYTPNRGTLDLRAAICRKLEQRNGLEVTTDQIVVASGATNAILLTYLALLDPDDAVLVPDPGWPNFTMAATAMGARSVGYPLLAGNDFLPDLDALDHLCRTTPGSKILVINTPSNPTGAVFNAETLDQMIRIASSNDMYVLSDECYEEILFEGVHVSAARFDDTGRVISIFSMSKTYAMTGWRLGYLTASWELADVLAKAQEIVTACASSVSQKAAEAALGGPQELVGERQLAYRQRRDLAVRLLESEGLLITEPKGAFYIMANIASCGIDSYDFCRRLVDEYHVAVAPGDAFGIRSNGMVRVSLAADDITITEGIGRLAKAVKNWS